jgi:polyisoprenyl-phosphate glycosyltransferase
VKSLTIVSGCYNEAENIGECVNRIRAVMATLPQYSFDIIVIDNAPTDGTRDILRRLAAEDRRVKVILNQRNFGHIRSSAYGLMQARGDAQRGFTKNNFYTLYDIAMLGFTSFSKIPLRLPRC